MKETLYDLHCFSFAIHMRAKYSTVRRTFFCVPTPCIPSSFLLSETDERLHDDEDDDDCDDDLAKRHVSHAADKKPKKKKAKAGGIPAIS